MHSQIKVYQKEDKVLKSYSLVNEDNFMETLRQTRMTETQSAKSGRVSSLSNRFDHV